MESKASKVIFLDIDGVLTNTDIDGTSFKHLDPSRYKLSEHNLKILGKVLEQTGAKIVITSNWRKFTGPDPVWHFGGKDYHSTLVPFIQMHSKHVIGMLPPERHISKCDCLELWFEDNPWLSKSKGKYVIFEDELSEMYQENLEYAKHLVLTDYHYGMTEQDASKAIALLS